MQKQVKQLASERYNWPLTYIDELFRVLEHIEDFPADANIFDYEPHFTEDMHKMMRLQAEWYVAKAFKAMKFEMDDNLKETPKRVVKCWMGDSLDCDTELGGGRFSRPVRLPTFPNKRGQDKWITKKVRLVSTCSHHFLPFTGDVVIRYKPKHYVLGISKLQRITNHVANRFWLQEDLTKVLHTTIAKAADVEADSVKVRIVAKHGCEMHRGVKNTDCEFITEE